jgi:hypothetical protein
MTYEHGMNPVDIVNSELKDILERISRIVQSIDPDKVRQIPRDETPEEWCGEDYRKHIISKGRGHEGFPEMLAAACLEPGKFIYDGEERTRILQDMESCIAELCSWAGAHRRALTAIYLPGGFISWHNNANAHGYNVLFTWSEEGDGQWEHIEPVTGEHVVIPDVKGWQCKYGYYGTYDEPEHVLYHAAKTNCLRCTVAFVFNGNRTGKNMAEMLIDEIRND